MKMVGGGKKKKKDLAQIHCTSLSRLVGAAIKNMNRYLNGGRHKQPSSHHTYTFVALLWVDINLYDLTCAHIS